MKKTHLLFGLLCGLVLTACPSNDKIDEITYTIKFNNYDGTNLQTLSVKENVVPEYTGTTPTRPDDTSYSYTFEEWNPKVVAATKDATYVATYASTELVNKYTIKFVNYDGTVLETKQVVEGTLPEYTGDTPTKPDNGNFKYAFTGWDPEIVEATAPATYTAVYSVSEELGVKTIAEVKELCKSITDLNEAGIAVDYNRKVTIRGLAVAQTNLVKTTKKFGLDISEPAKVFLGDSTGMIACATRITKDGHSLWGKLSNYVGQPQSKYEVTGYLSIYLNQPEILVPADSYTWDENLDVEFDVKAAVKSVSKLNKFYDDAVATNYNCAGHGYGDVCTIEGLRVVDHRDKVYICTDGEKMVKVFGNNTTLIDDRTYDVTGYISLTNWVPALSALAIEPSGDETPELSKNIAVSTSMTTIRNIKGSKEDTNVKQDTFIRSFAHLYKANVYGSCYQEGGKLYITVSDKYDSSKTYVSGDEVAVSSTYEMVAISNDNYWNITEDEMDRFCPIRYWLFQEETFDFYFVPFLQEFRTYNRVVYPLWKVFAINSLLPEPPVD